MVRVQWLFRSVFPGEEAAMSPEQIDQVTRAVAGDKDALVELLQVFGPDVERRLVLSRKWQGQLDAGDVMQVTYLEAFAHIGEFDPVRAVAFPAWLTRIAENNLRDAIRALEAGKNPPPELRLDPNSTDHGVALFDVLTSGGDSPSRQARWDETRRILQLALAGLPDDYAQVVQQYDLDGCSVEQVAAALGRSTGAVFMLRMRAHDRLRALLGRPSQILDSRS